MIQLVREILSRTVDEDLDTRQEAILEIALLIEKHSPSRDKQDYYESMLSPELLSISLNEEEQIELVHEVGRIILSDKGTGSLVWALTKSHSLDALDYLLAYICREPHPKDGHGIWQALLGIDRSLYVRQSGRLHNQALDLARRHNLFKFLEPIERDCGEDVRKTVRSIKETLAGQSHPPDHLPDEPGDPLLE
jgi:hypothetical protein